MPAYFTSEGEGNEDEVANAELSGLFYAGHFPDMPFGVYTPAIGSDVLKKEIKDSEENVEIVRYQRKIDFVFFCFTLVGHIKVYLSTKAASIAFSRPEEHHCF